MSEWSPSSPDTHNTEVDAAAVPAVGESESPETVLRKSGYGNPFFIKNSQVRSGDVAQIPQFAELI